MAAWTVEIDRWHPLLLNRIIKKHWAVQLRLKKADYAVLAGYCVKCRVPKAAGRRAVETEIVLGPRQRAGDGDGYLKILLDGLVACGVLVDDSRQWCLALPPTFVRGKAKATRITLRDIGPDAIAVVHEPLKERA